MAYGLNAQLFVENGPTIQVARNASVRAVTGARAWRMLDADRRIALVNKALRAPANDEGPDGYPVAL